MRTQELAKSLVRLTEIAWMSVNSQAFAAAFELGVFEALATASLTPEELAERIEIRPTGCRRLLLVLEGVGLVERDGERFRNSSLGQLCSSKSAINLGPVAIIKPFDRMMEYLPDALREYSPMWQKALGITAADAFQALYADPLRLRGFAELMNTLSVTQGRLIAETF